MIWEDLLKNAKVTGSSKGTTLDSNRIKIKKPEKCKEKLVRYSANAARLNKPMVYDIFTLSPSFFASDESWQELPEEVACEVIKKIDDYFLLYPELIEGYFRDINFSSLMGNGKVEKFNIGGKGIEGYLLIIDIRAYRSAREAWLPIKRNVHINYWLFPNHHRHANSLLWWISCECHKEAGNLSDSELDWRK